MESIFFNYITSNWLVYVNLPILILFTLMAYDAYAKKWSAKTGKYKTTGRITWSGSVDYKHSLISYSYTVNGTHYNGTFPPSPFMMKKLFEKYPKGKEIKVYYSCKDPGYSTPNWPPSHSQIIGDTVIKYLIAPLLFFNIVFMYIHFLFNVKNI